MLSWDSVFEDEGGGHYQRPLPSSHQISSSHLDTMWEQGTEAMGIAEGRVKGCFFTEHQETMEKGSGAGAAASRCKEVG